MRYRTTLTMAWILLLLLASLACDPTATPTSLPTTTITVARPTLTNMPVPTAIPTPTPTFTPTPAPAPRVATPTVSTEVEAEEYAVYSALIKSEYVRETVKLIVILDHTDVSYMDMDAVLSKITLPPPIVADFAAKNRHPSPLGEYFDLGIKYALVSPNETTRIFQSGRGWTEFYEKYPDSQGIMGLSRVGFNANQRVALVYVGNQGHYVAGSGWLVLLGKSNGVWHIVKLIMVWIS